MNYRRWLCVLGMVLMFYSGQVVGKPWRIGILAIRGETHMYATWQPWADWLNTQFSDAQFELLPLQLNQLVDHDIDTLDFVISNQAQFFYLNDRDVRWLVTLDSLKGGAQNSSHERIGSAIIVRNNSVFEQLSDLKHYTLTAVGDTAFGGFLLGYRELYRQGLREGKNVAFIFTGFPVDQTILALEDPTIAGAIAPVCILEQLIAENQIAADAFRVLAPKDNHLNCAASTELLPNWSLAALPHVPDALVAEMIKHLLDETPAQLPQWAPPFSSTQADRFLREIHRHPQQDVWKIVQYWFMENKSIIGLIALFILLNYLWGSYQVRRKSKALAQAYADMHQYERQLIKADRLSLLGEMTAGIGHEINQPLAAIRMYTEGLKKQTELNDPTHSQLPILDKILLQVDRSKQIMHNLSTWVKGKNKENETIHPIALHKLFQDTSQFIIKNSVKLIHVTIHCDKALMIENKQTMLEEVICNCLLNAIQAQADHIIIDAQSQDGQISFAIIDNGHGFSDDELSFPFVPFRSSKKDGLGLGLVICKRLVQSMQGSITLQNRADQRGAIVQLTLPKHLRPGTQ